MLKKCTVQDFAFLNEFSDQNTLQLIPISVDYFNTYNKQNIRYLNTLLNNTNIKNIQNIISCSINAIIALLLGLGYTANEIPYKLNDLGLLKSNNKQLRPLSVIVENEIQSTNHQLSKKEFTCLNEDNFLVWAQKQIVDKLHDPLATFVDLRKQSQANPSFKKIHLIGLNLTTNRLVVLNDKNTPNLPIAIAVRICMSIFTMFSVVEIKDLSSSSTSTYMDGGIVLQHVLH